MRNPHVLQFHFNWKTVLVIAGVTRWNFYFRRLPGAIRNPEVVIFLIHVPRHVHGNVLVIWDGLRSTAAGSKSRFCLPMRRSSIPLSSSGATGKKTRTAELLCVRRVASYHGIPSCASANAPLSDVGACVLKASWCLG